MRPALRELCAARAPVPPASEWGAVETALYTPDQFSMSTDEAAALRLAAAREGIRYHFEHNAFYRRYCDSAGLHPDDLDDLDDLADVPLVPEHIFKGCPGPEEFIPWLKSITSDEVAWPAPGEVCGSFDDQIQALRSEHGILVRSTSGSSGVPSFLPRDPVTSRRSAHWKIMAYAAMHPEILSDDDIVSVTLWPLDFSWVDLVAPPERVHALLDRKLGLETVIRAMTTPAPRTFFDRLLGRKDPGDAGAELLGRIADQLEELTEVGTGGILWGPPFLVYMLCLFVRDRDLTLRLGPEWRLELGGGWKLLEEKPLSEVELRELVHEVLDIPLGNIRDIYGSTECLGLCGLACEGRYKHVPHTVLHAMVVDEGRRPVSEGEWGRFAYLNPLLRSYPGFIVTEDRVRMFERCPACDRPGPVLDPEVTRMAGAEDRGCSNIVRQIVAEELEHV